MKEVRYDHSSSFHKFLICETQFYTLHTTAKNFKCFTFSKTVMTCKAQNLNKQWLNIYCINLQ